MSLLLNFGQAALSGWFNHKAGEAANDQARRQFKINLRNYDNRVNADSINAAGVADETVGAANDRLMSLREQMGAARVALGAQGASGSSAFLQDRELSGAGGLDISRLYANAVAQQRSIFHDMQDARSDLQFNDDNVARQAKATQGSLNRSTFGSYLQSAVASSGEVSDLFKGGGKAASKADDSSGSQNKFIRALF